MNGKSATSSILSQGLIYAAGNVASASVPLLFLPLLTRVLDPAEYGRVVNYFLLVTLAGSFAGLSLHGAVSVAWFRLGRAEFSAFGASCLCLIGFTTLIAAAAFAAAQQLPVLNLHVGALWGFIAACAAGATTVLNCRLALWQSQQRPFLATLTQLGYSIANVGLSLIGVLALGLGAAGRMGGAAAAGLLVAAIAVWSMIKGGEASDRPSGRHVRAALRFGVPLIPHTLAGVLMVSADRLAVASILGNSSIGVYGVAAQLGTVTSLIGDAFGKTYGPWAYGRMQRNDAESDLLVVGAVYLAIPGFLLLALVATLGIWAVGPWLLGARFLGALPLVGWFALGGALNGIYIAVVTHIFYSRRTELLSMATVASGFLGLAVASGLVHRYGAQGGALAYVITHAVGLLATTLIAVNLRPMPWARPMDAVRHFLHRAW